MSNSVSSSNDKRRDFLSTLLLAIGLITSGVMGLRNILAYIFPTPRPPMLRKLLIGRVGEIEPGSAKELEIGGRLLFLIHLEDSYRVFSGTCTHLGCQVDWESHRNRFFCPCHNGIFAPDGEVAGGPPPRPLDEFRVEVEGSLIFMWMEEQQERGWHETEY